MFTSVRLKLALWFAGSLALILVAVGATAYFVLRQSLDSEINDSIVAARNEVLRMPVQTHGRPNNAPAPPSNDDGHNDGDGDNYASVATDIFIISTDAGGVVQSNPRQVNLTGVDFGKLVSQAGTRGAWSDISSGGTRYRIDTVPGAIPGTYLLIGRSLEFRDSQLQELTTVMLIGGLAGLVAATAGGLWLAGRSLIPIRKSFETQRRFVSDASHELRTPIAVVRANNELLLRHPEATVEENLDQVEAIAAESEHMTRLVEDLLTLARADEGRIQLSRETFDLCAMAEDIARDLSALAEAKGVELRTELGPAQVEGDQGRIRQLMLILLDNALKYTPAGGVVTLSTRKSGRRVELAVRDTGPGIAPEYQQRVFDRFFRVDEARGRGDGGSGLGLAIAKWIAEAHGGSLSVESAPGHGSTFTARLPGKD